jgi:hypothetical protein
VNYHDGQMEAVTAAILEELSPGSLARQAFAQDKMVVEIMRPPPCGTRPRNRVPRARALAGFVP